MKRLVLTILWAVSLSVLYADNFLYPVSIGVGGGCTNFRSLEGEVYLKGDLYSLLRRKSEIKLGVNRRIYSLNLNHVTDIEVFSFGFYADAALFPFTNGLFIGIRWQAFGTVGLPETTQMKLKETDRYEGQNLTAGSGLYFPVGYLLPLSNKLNIRLTALPGFQYFKVSQLYPSQGLPVENHYPLVFDFVLGLEMKL